MGRKTVTGKKMDGYNKSFAPVYNRMWTDFADRVAPKLVDLYAQKSNGINRRPVLDLCCGVGTVALHFLASGYDVHGVDVSEYMLNFATDNAREFIKKGNARFTHANVVEFKPENEYGLAISTFDSLNHLENIIELGRVIENTWGSLERDGIFIFDLNTKHGLQYWGDITIDDDEEAMIVKRGGYDHTTGRAFYKLSGFLNNGEGLYKRFEEMVVETGYDCQEVKDLLLKAGFADVYFASENDLETPIVEPEKEDRVFFIATK
jgi:SAM-dependent methyltransferase